MRVLLIYADEKSIIYDAYAELGSFLPPLGIAYIAAVLEKSGHEVKIIDNSVMQWSLDKLIEETKAFSPECIGLGATTPMFPFSNKLAKIIKKELPNVLLVIGGPGVTADKEAVLKSNFDFGVYGEGEYTLLELISQIENNRDYGNIKGLIINKEGNKKINEPRPYIENLDELPRPALHLLPSLNHYRMNLDRSIDFPVGTIVSSRGCPYHCAFCDRSVFGNKFRAHSAERVIDEIKRLINEFGVKEIDFEDDLFIFDKKRVREICALIKKENIKIKWQCTARADLIDEDLVKVMSDAGCWLISIGVESGSERILKLIKKGITVNHVKNAVKIVSRNKIKPRGYFIINHPTETREEMEKSMRLALSLPFHTILVCITTPFPNTELWNLAKQNGTFEEENEDIAIFSKDPNFVTKGFTKEEIVKLTRKFYIRFFLRPKQMFRYMSWVLTLPPRQSYRLVKHYAKAIPIILKG